MSEPRLTWQDPGSLPQTHTAPLSDCPAVSTRAVPISESRPHPSDFILGVPLLHSYCQEQREAGPDVGAEDHEPPGASPEHRQPAWSLHQRRYLLPPPSLTWKPPLGHATPFSGSLVFQLRAGEDGGEHFSVPPTFP